ncbi:malic enzyme-like NAD(P)-binding protein [Candidatus Coxiella mudrowiae]|uniref:malic enzyme-like NAD(P)-binding protein n=1 Tax=Candidatus Coxiella mudrowiae TaxID=2054173 RepID=UPI001F1E550A|nr:malic enzyme-like NAD(P)-binding protein [Candidatus Coxiella mudrowiae]
MGAFFERTNAYRNLIKYRDVMYSFNDDIQGTGAVTLGAILAALKITHSTPGEQRIVIYGGSTAGIGITDTIFRAVSQNGLSEAEARKLFFG